MPLTHLRYAHGRVSVSRPDLIEVYVNLGIEFNVPVFFLRNFENEVSSEMFAHAERNCSSSKTQNLPILDYMTQLYTDGEISTEKAGSIP